MISASDFRNGVTIEIDGQVCQVVEFQHVKPGKGAAFVRTREHSDRPRNSRRLTSSPRNISISIRTAISTTLWIPSPMSRSHFQRTLSETA